MSVKTNKKKSLVVLIASSFWLGYVALTTWQYYLSADKAADTLIQGRKTAMEYVITSATNNLVDDNIALFESQMKQSRQLYLTDFYILQKNGKAISFFSSDGSKERLDFNYTRFDEMIDFGVQAFKSVRVFDYTLTVGINVNKPAVIWGVFKSDFLLIVKDILTVTALLSALLFLYLKDIIHLSKVVSSKNRQSLSHLKSLSREGSTLLKASQSFQAEQEHLKGENSQYSDTITPAILNEMKSGKKAPYTFDSTMIRVDLNGYTQIFLEKREEYITEIMNQYFLQAREIIERYGGLVYQYVGDEIVFHIKENKLNSQALAAACVKSLFEVAENVERHLPDGASHHFKIKCCLVSGKMRFINLDTGYALSGLSLIETARLLSQVEDKTKSSVSFYLEAHRDFEFLCQIESQKTALFKGFQNQTEFGTTSNFQSVDYFLEKKEYKRLAYYRSDKDLTAICKHFAKNISIENESEFFLCSRFIKNFTVKKTTPELVEAYTSLLQTAIVRNSENWLSDKALSTVIAIASHLVPSGQATEKLALLLSECLNHRDHRTCANSIIVLGDVSKTTNSLREFIHSSNNRVSADAMLIVGKTQFDSELADKLVSFITSKNPTFQASGLFVARELLAHYETCDPVFFESNEALQRVRDVMPLVKKQAA